MDPGDDENAAQHRGVKRHRSSRSPSPTIEVRDRAPESGVQLPLRKKPKGDATDDEDDGEEYMPALKLDSLKGEAAEVEGKGGNEEAPNVSASNEHDAAAKIEGKVNGTPRGLKRRRTSRSPSPIAAIRNNFSEPVLQPPARKKVRGEDAEQDHQHAKSKGLEPDVYYVFEGGVSRPKLPKDPKPTVLEPGVYYVFEGGEPQPKLPKESKQNSKRKPRSSDTPLPRPPTFQEFTSRVSTRHSRPEDLYHSPAAWGPSHHFIPATNKRFERILPVPSDERRSRADAHLVEVARLECEMWAMQRQITFHMGQVKALERW